jgi:hypothetical protein
MPQLIKTLLKGEHLIVKMVTADTGILLLAATI